MDTAQICPIKQLHQTVSKKAKNNFTKICAQKISQKVQSFLLLVIIMGSNGIDTMWHNSGISPKLEFLLQVYGGGMVFSIVDQKNRIIHKIDKLDNLPNIRSCRF